MKLWMAALAASSLLGIGAAGAASPTQAGIYTIQAQYYYYDPYYRPYYYRYPGYRYLRPCEEDLGYGRRGQWGCG